MGIDLEFWFWRTKGFIKGGVFTRSTYGKCGVSTMASTGYILGDTCTSNMFMGLLYILKIVVSFFYMTYELCVDIQIHV